MLPSLKDCEVAGITSDGDLCLTLIGDRIPILYSRVLIVNNRVRFNPVKCWDLKPTKQTPQLTKKEILNKARKLNIFTGSMIIIDHTDLGFHSLASSLMKSCKKLKVCIEGEIQPHATKRKYADLLLYKGKCAYIPCCEKWEEGKLISVKEFTAINDPSYNKYSRFYRIHFKTYRTEGQLYGKDSQR